MPWTNSKDRSMRSETDIRNKRPQAVFFDPTFVSRYSFLYKIRMKDCLSCAFRKEGDETETKCMDRKTAPLSAFNPRPVRLSQEKDPKVKDML